VLWLLGFLVQRNHLGQRLLGTLHAHLGKLVQRLLLIARLLSLRAQVRGSFGSPPHPDRIRPTVSAQTATKLTFASQHLPGKVP